MVKIVATRCHIVRLKCTKFDFETLLGELTYITPQSSSLDLRGPTSKTVQKWREDGGW